MALITVSGTLKDPSGVATAGSVTFQLSNYGASIPRVLGTNSIVATNVSFVAASTGVWTGSIQGNDTIDPGGTNTPPTTYYEVSFKDVAGNTIATLPFQFTGAGPANLDSQAPLNPVPSPTQPASNAALLGANQTFTGNNTFTGSTTFSSVSTITAPLSTSNLDGFIYVDGVTYPQTDAGIVSAIAACADGGTVYLPSATYLCNATLPITITKRINIVGSGWGTILQINSGVGSGTDVFLLKPSNATDIQGVSLRSFRIQPQSGTPARYGINFDGTNASFSYMEIDKLRIDALGNYAIAVTNAGSNNNGTPYTTSIRDCVINGGINLNGVGDDILILRNTFTGARDINITAAPVGRVGTDGGAHGFLFMENDVTSAGGIVIINAWQGALLNNDIEATVTSTETNNAVIDLQGNSSPGAVQNFIIQGNYIGANSSFVADAIRVDKAYHTIIRNNYVSRGTGVAYRITANANRTVIADNTQAPNGEAITVWLADLGSFTTVDYFQPSSAARVMTNSGFGSNSTSTPFFYFPSVQGRAGSTSIWGWASGVDPSSAGLDTGLSRIAAGLVGVGNGGQADFTSAIKQTGGIDVGTARANRIKYNQGTLYSGADAAIVISAGWGNTAAVSAASGTDQALSFSVTSNGTGLAANPTIIVTFKDGTWTQNPQVNVVRNDLTSPYGSPPHTVGTSATAYTITFNGTPAGGGAIYKYIVQVSGN